MQFLWFGAPANLESWARRPVHPQTLAGPDQRAYWDYHSRIIAVEPPGPPLPGSAFERAAEAILHYRVFPEWLGSGVLNRAVEVGDTVGLRYRLLPGVQLFFASRVSEVFDERNQERWVRGFTYQTLAGHPEIGAETFAVQKELATGAVIVSLHAWSRLGLGWLRPLEFLARRWQLQAGRAALDSLEQQAGVRRFPAKQPG